MLKSTERFSNRVEDYVLYRPSYPREIIQHLRSECGLMPDWTVADLGAGPGNLARLFLENGNPVIGVEPNREMREAGDVQLASFPGYRSVDGTAETTGLSDDSVDLITAGQAFHWFDVAVARAEAARILKPGGWVALVWNNRHAEGTPFLDDYEAILQTVPEYRALREHRASEDAIREFFSPREVRLETFPYRQLHDWPSFLGRVLSSSYAPKEDAGFEGALRSLFERYAVDGAVTFEYDTQVYYGQI